MENAADALKMAFAVFVFIIALSITFYLLTQTKNTADTVLWHTDKTNYYNHMEGSNVEYGREVGIETIIATLEKFKYEEIFVKIIDGVSETTFYDRNTPKSEIDNFINANLGRNDKYIETIQEITTAGMYRVANDGTRITIHPGESRIYIIYTKI